MNINSRVGGLLDDPWIQMFGFVGLVSGLFSVHYFLASARAPAAVQAPAAAPVSAAPAPAPAIPPAAASNPPAGPAQATPAPKTPRRPGHWVVDTKLGPDADTALIAEAVSNAVAGDIILLKPGIYLGPLAIMKSITIVGDGNAPGDARIEFSGPRTIDITGGAPTFRNIALSNEGTAGQWVVVVTDARLILKNVELRASSQGIHVVNGELEAADSTLDASTALFVEGKSAVNVIGATASGGEATIRADGPAVQLSLRHTTVRNSRDAAVAASNSAHVSLSEIQFHDDADAIVAQSGSEVRVSHAVIEENHGCGVTLSGGATVILEQT
ncbi:MAG: right-handed parallel beta-helix repeat-containing protein, partial [Elusimicrobiota bacterium]